MGDFEGSAEAAKTERRQPAPKRSLEEACNDGDLEGDVMVTNETELPAVLARPRPVHAPAGGSAPTSTGFLDDLIASIAAEKVESDKKFADFEDKFAKVEQAMGALSTKVSDMSGMLHKMMGMMTAAQQSGNKLGQSKGQTGTIHGKTRRGGRSPTRARSPQARSRSRSSASEEEFVDATPR